MRTAGHMGGLDSTDSVVPVGTASEVTPKQVTEGSRPSSYTAIARRQMTWLASGSLALLSLATPLALDGRISPHLLLMLLLAATAGLSSMSVP